MGCDRSGKLRPKHYQCFQQHYAYFQNGNQYGVELSGNRKDLRAGKKVLRRTEISKQSGKGCEKGAASNPDGRRYYGHLCEQLPEDAA